MSIPEMFNKEILNIKDLIKYVASEAIISVLKERALCKELYTLLNTSLLKVKHAIENHIWIEQARELLWSSLFLQKKND